MSIVTTAMTTMTITAMTTSMTPHVFGIRAIDAAMATAVATAAKILITITVTVTMTIIIVEVTIAVYSNIYDNDNNNIFTNESRESFQSSGCNVLKIFFSCTFYLINVRINLRT